jgi:two-component sensor histidine kinase
MKLDKYDLNKEQSTKDELYNSLILHIEEDKKEKETIIMEMHHRFKNNLQVIASLLSLQGEYIREEKYRRMFINSAERVNAMAMIHEKLYQADNQINIFIDTYLRDLVIYLLKSYSSIGKTVIHEVKTNGITLPFTTAVPCGLIVNELISNSLKYAFPEKTTGKININIEQIADEYILSYNDDGVGLPEHFTIESSDSLGILIVKTLVEQLKGTLEISNNKGTNFIIKFPTVINFN